MFATRLSGRLGIHPWHVRSPFKNLITVGNKLLVKLLILQFKLSYSLQVEEGARKIDLSVTGS